MSSPRCDTGCSGQADTAAGAGPWVHLSLFWASVQEQCLSCSSKALSNRSLTSHEFLLEEFVFFNQLFQTRKKKFQLLLLSKNGQTESPWERDFTHHIQFSVGLRNTQQPISLMEISPYLSLEKS